MADRALKHLTREHAYEYDMVAKDPKLRVAPGERFSVETEDSTNGRMRTRDDLPVPVVLGPHAARDEYNPCAGPIVVDGARAGDVLAVTIHDIVVDDQGVNAFFPGSGPLADSARYPECRGPRANIIRHLPGPSGTTSDGIGILDGRWQWPLQPHVGTIGTAPPRPVASGSDTLYGQSKYGGNLDCRDICVGNTVLLPVGIDGAYLYVGDVHASMGDGEFIGNADESRAVVTLSCDILPARSIPWVRVETADSIVQLSSYRPLEAAIKRAFLWMLDWLVQDYGFDAREAYVQLGVNPDVRIRVYQLVDHGRLAYTAGVAFPRTSLQGPAR